MSDTNTPTVWVKVCAASEIPSDKAMGFTVNGKRLILTRCGDAVHVLDGFCSHMVFPLAGSKVENCVLTCPLHRSKFHVEDGSVVEWATFPPVVGPALGSVRTERAIKTYNIRVENGDVSLEWPGESVDNVRVSVAKR